MKELFQLPDGWNWSSMGEVADVIGGGTPKTKAPENYENGTIPWLTPADLSGYTSKYIEHGRRSITQHGLNSSSARMMPAGTVLFSSRAPIGYVAIAKNEICTNQGFKSFVPKSEATLPDYIYWWLKGVKGLAESMASGTTFLELSGAKAKRIPVPIAPLDQQKQIVAEIEKQFSRLDEAVANLKRVKANLKRYKASVLQAAVTGKLTEEWRKQNPDVEPARKLLERILTERHQKWEETELARLRERHARGHSKIDEDWKPKNDKWKEKYQEHSAPDVSSLPDLPGGWQWVRLDTIANVKGGITKGGKRKESDVDNLPYLRVANVQRGHLALNEMKYIDVPCSKMGDLLLAKNDILFNEGGDRDKLGRGWIWEGQIERCTHQNHVFRARLFSCDVEAMLVSHYGNTFGQKYFMNKGKQTTNLASINKTMLSALPVPLSSISEQRIIIQEIESRLSVAEGIEQTVDANLKRAERLRQSILKQAFSGKLVKI